MTKAHEEEIRKKSNDINNEALVKVKIEQTKFEEKNQLLKDTLEKELANEIGHKLDLK